ncbi:MAG: methyl-accepting chemotaxis protein [Acidobacteriota bacterium]|nr:methyl-accepting chemotaxis protein [Acidobacteriota bacterium]
MKSQMTIGKKFTLTATLLLTLTVALGVGSLVSINSLRKSVDTIVTDPLPGVYRISAVESLLNETRGDDWRHIAATDPNDKQAMEQKSKETNAKIGENLQEYERTITTAEDRDTFGKIKPAIDQYLQNVDSAMLLSRTGKTAEAYTNYVHQAKVSLDAATAATHALVELNRRNGDVDAAEAQHAATSGRVLVCILLGASLLSGILLTLFVVRSMNKALRQAVTELSEGSDQLASAASQVSASSQSLAQGSSEQAASLEETSASSEEINAMARQNTENSRSAADLVTQSQQKFVQTNEALAQTVAAMGEINTQSGKISKIIKVIDEIAFQTNILALNAAVEAARAGEAGMGFAVVADEVRNLAQRCAQAAKDTTDLIDESIAKSNDGKLKVDEVAGAIRAITAESAKVKMLVDEVNIGSQEQARGIDQVAKAISQMEQVTQTTAANAEESAAAAEELTAQSETLKDIVERLTAMVGGGTMRDRAGYIVTARRPAAPAWHAAAKPLRERESRSGLSALRVAVSHKKSNGHDTELAVASAKTGKDAFPLEEEFKEF